MTRAQPSGPAAAARRRSVVADEVGGEAREGLLPRLHIDELLGELQTRLTAIVSARDRLRGLVEAIVAVGSELDLQTVLNSIVRAAATLVDAQYGALGVIGDDDRLSQFLTVGIDDDTYAQIGP